MATMDVQQPRRSGFPQSLPEFSSYFPMTRRALPILGARVGPDGFVCPHCGLIAEPFRIVTRPGVLECRACRRQAGLLVGTVMERSHTPISVWFWAAYLVAARRRGCRRCQFQRQLGLTRYQTAFGILHKLRRGHGAAGPGPIGGRPKDMWRLMRRGQVEGRAAKAGASTTKRWWPPLSKFRRRKPGTAQESKD